MSETQWNVIIWGSFALSFLLRELPAVFKLTPWIPLSNIIWDLEHYIIVSVIVFYLCLRLLLHLVFKVDLF